MLVSELPVVTSTSADPPLSPCPGPGHGPVPQQTRPIADPLGAPGLRLHDPERRQCRRRTRGRQSDAVEEAGRCIAQILYHFAAAGDVPAAIAVPLHRRLL